MSDSAGGRRNAKGRQRPERAHGGTERSAQRPADRSRTTDPQRLAAYAVMRAVADGAYANLELPRVLREKRIQGRDAAFTTELVYGAVRMHGLYDPIISTAAARPVSQIDPAVLDTLRLGAHQLLGMRVPAHAAADETVGLARRVNGAGAAGFVNAVMRRISERDLAAWRAEVVPEGDLTARLAVEQSHPEWIVKAMRAALLGHGASSAPTVDADLEALMTADNEPARVALVARPGLATVEELVGAGARRSVLSRVGAVLSGGDPGGISAVREGRAAVQDEGSQLVALALAAVPVSTATPAPQRWLDLCAGPGGKAGLLAGLALEAGADLVANEVSEHRADLVRQTLRAAGQAAAAAGRQLEVRTSDGREIGADEPGRYHRVLVDAPCTGLGALRRRPEARWRRTPADLADLGRLQRELLASALDAVAPGGVVAYATCSPHLAETQFVVADVTKRRDDVEPVEARDHLLDAAGIPVPIPGTGPTAQLWPHLHGTDGMFLALLRKKAT
jgi:16S rRNA (cytosine967-C5)-methyltransferase